MSFRVITLWLIACSFMLDAAQSAKTKCPQVISSLASGVPGVPGVPGLNGRDGAKGDQGLAGKPGNRGPIGPKGTQGHQGDKGEQGSKGAKGEQGSGGVVQRNWKQCAWENINETKNNGLIKECVFHKKANNTALKVEYNGDYRIAYCLDCCKRWYFTFNGAECRKPLVIDGIMHIGHSGISVGINIHRTTHIAGYCEGINKGTVKVAINVGNCVGKKGGNTYTGWNSVTRIMIEEFSSSQ